MSKITPLATQWLEWDENTETRNEIQGLLDAGKWNDLSLRLSNRIQFGTAGLRGRMQAGFSSMNHLTVIQASQGIAEYMLKSMKYTSPSDLSVLIGYDIRHHSSEFAQVAATAFSNKGITVLLYEDYVPTPFVSFGVQYFKADAGIMVTASHNPKWDNGYKVYWSNGCQINTPVDQHIAKSIAENLKPWSGAFNPFRARAAPGVSPADLREKVTKAYLERLALLAPKTTGNAAPKPFCYTPMHGVGNFVMEQVAKNTLNWSVGVVKEQAQPDPEFSTVEFPNPEEPGALDASFAFCDTNEPKLDTIVANDPDADRLAVAERVVTEPGKEVWHKFTGDQLGILLAAYLIETTRAEGKPIALLSSAVSSGMLKKLAKSAGAQYHHEETLTGFKWIGNQAKSLVEKGYQVIFGYEEALGYMIPEVSWDKDGLAAATLYLSARRYWEAQGLTPFQKLGRIYDDVGYHESINTYFRSPSPAVTTAFFTKLRGLIEMKPSLGNMAFDKWRDVTKGHVVGAWDNELQDSGSQMITCVVVPDNGDPSSKVTFTLRGSGTEPKIKIYLEASSSNVSTANSQAVEAVQAIISEWVGSDLSYTRNVTTSSGRLIVI